MPGTRTFLALPLPAGVRTALAALHVMASALRPEGARHVVVERCPLNGA